MSDFETTSRGFKRYEPIATAYGHKVQVYESSAAGAPHVWLSIDGRGSGVRDDQHEVSAHLTIEQAKAVRKALKHAIRNHYQNETAIEQEHEGEDDQP